MSEEDQGLGAECSIHTWCVVYVCSGKLNTPITLARCHDRLTGEGKMSGEDQGLGKGEC